MMTLDEQILTEAKETRDRLLDLQHGVDRARVDYQHVIRRLHAAGGSLREIAEELGLSHQRVHQIVDGAPEEIRRAEPRGRMGRRGMRGPFGRFTRPARKAVVHAQEESLELGHNYIGTEHILLGLFRVTEGGAAAALEALSLNADQVRAEIVKELGEPTGERRRGAMPMTPRSKQALEHAAKEAARLGYRWVGTEHVLLGLVAVKKGLAAEILERLGADPERVRTEVERVLGR